MLYLHFLGTFHITFGDNREPAIETAKAKALLAYLAVENSRPHRREQLAAMFWPESGQKAAHQNLRQALYVLRQQLRPPTSGQDGDEVDGSYLVVTRQDASFNTDSEHWIDAVLFSELTRSTEMHLHRRLDACPQCIGRLEAAADLYTGDFLSGLTVPDAEEFEAWRVAQQESLHTQALVAFDALASYYERRGEIEKARRFFARRLELEPWDEETHRRVMRMLARHGLRGAALQQFESCKRILEVELGVDPSSETLELAQQIHDGTLPQEPDPDLESPYKGLNAFSVTDAADYFGREAVIDNLQQILLARSVVVIIGPSGSGKSSLLRAGLLPNLLARSATTPDEPNRPQSGSAWAVIECRPGSDPFVSLAQAIAGSTLSRGDAMVLAAQLRTQGARVTDYISIPTGTQALLCIDQFEELYTLCQAMDVRRAFIDLLINTIRPDEAERQPISIIGTLRADFVSQALAYRPLADLLQTGGLILGAMDRNELRRAIQEPARNRGFTFEAGLIERLLDDVGEEPGNLPLLQFALSELWLHREGDKLTHDAYDAIGGVGGGLAHYADTIYSQLTPDEEILARRLFVQLVQPGDETGDTRRPTVRTELGEDTWHLARRLADLRLVVTGRNLNEESVELIHEALIRNWDRLGEWMDEDREFRRWQQRLRTNVQQWTASGREPDALLRGLLLGEAEQWADQRREELSEVEQAYIDASLANRAAQRAADEEARQLELERAQTLATIEHQRAEAEHNRAELERGARRRLRLLAIGMAAALALAIVAAVAAAGFGSIARQSAKEALARQLAAQSINLADDDTDLALLLSTEALARLEVPEDRTSFLTNFPVNGLLSRFFQGGSGDLQQIVVSPDGQEILAVDVSGSTFEASAWDDDTGMLVRSLLPPGEWTGAILSDDGSLLATTKVNVAQIWDRATGDQIGQFEAENGRKIEIMNFTADADTLMFKILGDRTLTETDSYSGTIVMWDIGSQTEKRRFEIPDDTEGVSLSPDGEILAVHEDIQSDLGTDRGVNLWDVATGTNTGIRLGGHAAAISQVAFSPDHSRIATASFDGTVRLWDATDGTLLHPPYADHSGRVLAVTFSPDGRILATGGVDRQIFLYDLVTDKQIGEPLVGHDNWVRALRFSHEGNLLYSGATGGGLIRWDLANRHPFDGHNDRVRSVALSPDGAMLATGGFDRRILLWDAQTGDLLKDLPWPHENSIIQVAFSPDGKKLAAVDGGNMFVLWNVPAGTMQHEPIILPGGDIVLIGLAFSPDGRYVAAGDFAGNITVFDANTGEKICSKPQAHDGWALSLAFAPDSKTLASGGTGGHIRLWNASNLPSQCIVEIEPPGEEAVAHEAWVTSLLFTSDGKTLISGSSDNTVKFWDTTTRAQIGDPLIGQETQIWGLTFYPPDGEKSLITLGGDGSVLIWDIASRTPLMPPLHTGLETESFAVSPDGSYVYLGSFDSRSERWHLDAPTWEKTSCDIAARPLTQEEWAAFFGDAPYNPICRGQVSP